jgi:conjugal transfer pilus assembly protein TraK
MKIPTVKSLYLDGMPLAVLLAISTAQSWAHSGPAPVEPKVDPIVIPAPRAPVSVSLAQKPSPVQPQPKAKVRDPLVVEPSLAIRITPPKEVIFPGVTSIAGESEQLLDSSRARLISMTNGGSQTVYFSAHEPNRIQLPFINPHVISTTEVTVDKRSNSNNVYISFDVGVKRAVQIYLENPEGGPVLGLQLVPKNIHAQTVIVEDNAPVASATQRKDSRSSDHITAIQSLIETVSLGGIPNGYSVTDTVYPAIVMNGLMVQVLKRFSNRDGDIYLYGVTNPGKTQITVRESEFDGDTVQAVSIYPKPLLGPGDKTQVVVVARKVKVN